jgi:SAM-dependent methyltransferase
VLGPLSRLVARALLWVRILRAFRGVNLASELNLWLSALADTLFYAVTGWRVNARLLLRGLYAYRLGGLGLAVVRGATDDLYYLLPQREGDVEAFIAGRLGEGSVFVDVGANVGYYTLLASRLVGPGGAVYAVEPIPSTAAMLRANVRLNDCRNVVVIKGVA